jgi:DUF4097 and DUF4098 domain-containing protein YvlB
MAGVALGLVRPIDADAEVTKTLALAQDAAKAFGVENLAGRMTVVAGSGTRAEVVATLHAESPAVLDAMRFEAVTDDKGRPALRVRYPADERKFRYPEGESSTETSYDGRKLKVTTNAGVLAYADLEVRLPKDVAEAWLRNGVGAIRATAVSGTIRFDTGSGNVTLTDVAGDIVADTGSGDVTASGGRGRFKCDTGSGDCEVSRFKGEALDLDTGSGSLLATDVEARRLRADTGSGDVRVTRATAEDVEADTGSGSVDLELAGANLTRVKADTGSGDVRIRLPKDASFELRADMGSGDLDARFADAQAILNRREVVGYRRADGRIKIDVDTGSGDVSVEPSR